MVDKKNFMWQIIPAGPGLKYKTLNPRNFQELSYGLHNDLLRCNKNTLVKDVKQESKALWDLISKV